MIDFYDEYKSFRNYMRRFDLVTSLLDLWHYSLHIVEGQPLPTDYAVGRNPVFNVALNQFLFPWDLDILTKECLLNAGARAERTLRNWRDLAKAINYLRHLDGVAFTSGSDEQVDVLLEMHRIAHRQFPWQTHRGVNPMVRALRVFGETAVESVVVRELGMTMRQFMQLGMALSGHFLKRWGMSINQDYTALGISREASAAFLKRITRTIEELRAETAKHQAYDRDWLYTWNPLEATPLVSFDAHFPERVLCPLPRYLSRRVSDGIFYDLIKSARFDNPYGNSFQTYIGDVAKMVCTPPRFTLLAEQPYEVSGQELRGVDWVLSDKTGHLFIECKTKRLTLDARILSDGLALEKDLVIMATAIVQHYLNIVRALDGKTAWQPDGLPVYPLLLTLEDWFILSPGVQETLKLHVSRLLKARELSDHLMDQMPFTIASANEFEIASQIIAHTSVASVMSKKTEPETRMWSLLPFLKHCFKDEMQKVNWMLFSGDWNELTPTAS